jgi:hypothetical protein
MLDTSFDPGGEEQRLGDLLDRLLDVIGGVTITTREEKLRGFSVLRGKMPGLASQRS